MYSTPLWESECNDVTVSEYVCKTDLNVILPLLELGSDNASLDLNTSTPMQDISSNSNTNINSISNAALQSTSSLTSSFLNFSHLGIHVASLNIHDFM